MLSAIQNFFDWFKGTIDSVWSFLQGIINGLITLVKMIPKAVSFITEFIVSLPVPIQVFATLTIAILVIYLIIGRETGGSD